MKINLFSIRAGDIIFSFPEKGRYEKIIQKLNVSGQRLLTNLRKKDRIAYREKLKDFPHVILGVGNGLVIHADGKSVVLEVATDAIDVNNIDLKVFRRNDITQEVAQKIAGMGVRYLQQKYRFAPYFFNIKKEDTSQFCSRLIACAYRMAGITLTELVDNKVLPRDLFKICQTSAWQEVTNDILTKAYTDKDFSALGNMNIPGFDEIPKDFFDRTEEMLQNSSKLSLNLQNAIYSQYRHTLFIEDKFDELVIAQLELAEICWRKPQKVDDSFADNIVKILSQLDNLLSLADLPDLDLLVTNTMFNTPDGESTESRYAGFPAAEIIREMEKNREAFRILCYLVMATIGLHSLRAQYDAEVSNFKMTGKKYGALFRNAFSLTDGLEKHLKKQQIFVWVSDRKRRGLYLYFYEQIINSIEFLMGCNEK